MIVYTAFKTNGDIIECFETIEDALKAIKSYEEEDKKYEDYTPDIYEVLSENYSPYDLLDETIVIQSMENINEYKRHLLSSLMFIFDQKISVMFLCL